MKYHAKDIFTPQGIFEEIQKKPNLDFLMNVFNIPRAFRVSGFGGSWNVGMHSFATALIAIFWSKFNAYPLERRNRLVIQALLHDVHEAVTGDILPMFKAKTTKEQLDSIQSDILSALEVKSDDSLKADLKVVDLIAFLYEIKQVSPSILNPKKLDLAHKIEEKQRQVLFDYSLEMGIKKEKIRQFLKQMDI